VPNRSAPWTEANLVAIDLEGSGPQDPAGEAMLEIALINPQRTIPRRPWISPGITNAVLENAPTLDEVAPTIIKVVNGATLVGHNVRVDWRLLHTALPQAAPIGLIDTVRLAKHQHPELAKGHGLQDWIERLGLSDDITRAAPDSQPHRALWDTIASATLLAALMRDTQPPQATLGALLAMAGLNLDGAPTTAAPTGQHTLWDT
jgi:DNA polymerase III subunit epsilon